jgi:lipopolysaccharide transport system ATP-binding protein
MALAIKVENLSKAYQLGEIGTGTLSRDIERWVAKVRGKEDPFLKVGETNDRTSKGNSDVVWSLKDINFEIHQGDAVGIIGRNGAGKSTLLKILSRVTSPTTGEICVKGRIASLLEVGTGFHPELTGRENIYLNGAILGMRKKEIKRQFDEIVDFAGVERYIDTPVKRYSSGMYVRLAFAVAAHLDSEILIVDEVLAVGDAEFQKKCLGKMNDVSKGEGRTVLFVSHNMGSIALLCNKGLLLQQGKVFGNGNINSIVDSYIASNNSNNERHYKLKEHRTSQMFFTEVFLTNNKGELCSDFDFYENINVNTKFNLKETVIDSKISVTIQGKNGEYLSTMVEDLPEITAGRTGNFFLRFKLPVEIIAPNNYFIRVALFVFNRQVFDLLEFICPFKIYDTGTKLSAMEGIDYGNYILDYEMVHNEVVG